jgi:hypothetical protein
MDIDLGRALARPRRERNDETEECIVYVNSKKYDAKDPRKKGILVRKTGMKVNSLSAYYTTAYSIFLNTACSASIYDSCFNRTM